MTMDALGWLDLAMVLVVLASLAIGLWRGAVYEIMSLAGWLLAWLVAQAYGALVGAALVGERLGAGRDTAGWAIAFVATLVVWRLLTWAAQRLLHASPLAPVDRGLGGLFGLVRGVVVVLALVMVVGLTPLAQRPAWRDAPSVHWAQALLATLTPVLPADWVRRRAGGFDLRPHVEDGGGFGAVAAGLHAGRCAPRRGNWSVRCAASSG